MENNKQILTQRVLDVITSWVIENVQLKPSDIFSTGDIKIGTIAKSVGVSNSTISRIKRDNISLDCVMTILKNTGISPTDFFGWLQEKS